MRAWINSLAVAAAMTFSAATLACDGAGKDGPKGTAGDTAKACSADKTACAKSCTNGKDAKAASHDKGLAAAGMPLMKYKVGDQVPNGEFSTAIARRPGMVSAEAIAH